MLNDEEKKAIEILKEFLEKLEEFNFDCQECGFNQQDEGKALKIMFNLIEKQSKEIEELKMITKEYDSFLGNEKIIIADKSYFDDGYFKEKFISKDKIKAKIEEFKIIRDTIIKNEKDFNSPMMTYDLKRNDYCEKMLQSLLEKE